MINSSKFLFLVLMQAVFLTILISIDFVKTQLEVAGFWIGTFIGILIARYISGKRAAKKE